MNPTRFPGGINNSVITETTGNLGFPDPTKFHTYFNDFDTYTAGDWVVTETGNATQALADGDGGWLLVTNAAADNDASFSQLAIESFALTAGKRAFFKTRFKCSDVTQSDLQFGLLGVDTTPLDVTDGIYMLKADGAATVDIYVRKDATTGSNSATAVATLSNDTFVTFGWAYDGVDAVEFFFNDVKVYTLDGSSTYLPDALLTPSFGVQNGEAVAKNMTLDYIFVAIER